MLSRHFKNHLQKSKKIYVWLGQITTGTIAFCIALFAITIFVKELDVFSDNNYMIIQYTEVTKKKPSPQKASCTFNGGNIVCSNQPNKENINISHICRTLGVLTPGEKCGEIDSVIRKLQFAKVNYNRPKNLKVDKPIDIAVVIDPTNNYFLSNRLADFTGEIITTQTKYTRTMSANLAGSESAFKIESIGQPAKSKYVSKESAPKWIWTVTPKVEGKHKLSLTLFAHIETEKKTIPPIEYEIFNEEFEVSISNIQRIKVWIDETDPIITFLTGLVGFVGTFSLGKLFIMLRNKFRQT